MESLFWAAVAGLFFSFLAVAYRGADRKGIPTVWVALGMGGAGLFWFGGKMVWEMGVRLDRIPLPVWILGFLSGAIQGWSVYLMRSGLRRGPMAPIWSAVNLVFVTPALYSVGFLGERLTGAQWLGLGAVAASIVVSSPRAATGSSAGRSSFRQRVEYGGLLVILVILPGMTGASLKYLATLQRGGIPLNPQFNTAFLFSLYAGLLAVVGSACLGLSRPVGHGRFLAVVLTGAGTASVVGMTLTAHLSRMEGGIGFALVSVFSVVFGALLSSWLYGEQRGGSWWASLGLAVASLLLFQTGGGGDSGIR